MFVVLIPYVEQTIVDQVIGGIADAEGVDPVDLDISLHQHVSTDAIIELVKHDSSAFRLQFETSNHVVQVTGDDQVIVDGIQKRELELPIPS